ncbi:MAG: hypothetical protein J6I31_06410 [Prevotella sp.]|nr:hypothetical protein [Prevotella sp.]
MKKIFLFSIKQVWELLKYIKPLYELIMAIVNVFRKDNDDNEKKEGKEEQP